MHMRSISAGAALVAAACVIGCHSGSDNTTGPGGVGPLHTIVVTPDTASIAIGATKTFTATGQDAQGHTVTGLTFFWSSNADSLATVNQSGVVTAVKLGSPQIAASTQGMSGFATVTVTPKPVGSIIVTPSHATIRVATTLQLTDTVKDASGAVLTGQAVTWSSDSSATVSVDGNGLITARQIGTATITATAGGKSAQASIIVSQIPVKSITIAPANPALVVGQTTQLTATTFDSAGDVLPGRVVRWKSRTPAVATVDSIAGLVTGVSSGTSRIVATSEGITDSVTATVGAAPINSVVLSPNVSQLRVGQSQQITATVTDVNGNPVIGATVTFMSNATTIASISSSTTTSAQVLAGPNAGTATITGTSGAKNGTATIIVSLVAVDSVNVTAAHDTLTLGHQDTLTATAFDSTGTPITGRPITWKSSNAAVATVSATGIVTTLRTGTVVIFATISGVTGSVTLQVGAVPVGSVAITPQSDTVLKGGQLQLAVTVRDSLGNVVVNPRVTWSSTNNAIATVTSTGLVTAVTPGTASIIAQDGTKADTNTTLVPQPVSSVIVAPSTSTISIGQTRQLTDTLKDVNGVVLTGRPVTWSSSNTEEATVSATGLVTAADTGTVTITVTAMQPSGNVLGTATVTVTQVPVASVVVFPTPVTIFASAPNNTVQLNDSTYDASHHNLAGRPVTWTPASGGAATVNASGLVTATNTAAAAVTITATSADGPSGSGTVNVLGHSQTVNANNLGLTTLIASSPSDSTTTASAQVIDTFSTDVSGTRTVTWTSSDPTTVTINGGASATVIAGTTVTISAISSASPSVTITATASDNSVSGNFSLTVTP